MRHTSLTAVGLLATSLLAGPALAQRSPDAGIEVALRTGLALPFGEVQDGTNLDSYGSSAIPIIVEGGYRLDSNLFFGAWFQYGFLNAKNPNNGSCSGSTSCDGSVVTLGLEGIYRFAPERTFAPWLGLGAGYEWSGADYAAPNAGAGATSRGFQALLQAGGDVRVNAQLVLGPFVQASVGRFDSVETRFRVGGFNTSNETDITNTSLHTWLSLGVRGAFGF